MPVAAYLGPIMVGAIVHPILSAALKASGRLKPEQVGGFMSGGYELVGAVEDALSEILSGDEFEGGVGGLFDDDEDEMIEGDGSSEIFGAAVKAAAKANAKKAAVKKAVAQKILTKNGALVRNFNLQSRRRNPLGFVPTSIPASSTIQVPAAPQNLFRAERLVIPSDIAFDFGIADIKVGNVSQLVQSAELPGALFSEVAIDTHVSWDTAEVGNQVSVSARNKTAAAIDFTAALLGTIAKR